MITFLLILILLCLLGGEELVTWIVIGALALFIGVPLVLGVFAAALL